MKKLTYEEYLAPFLNWIEEHKEGNLEKGPPASEAEITAFENAICHPIPEPLRICYSQFNGLEIWYSIEEEWERFIDNPYYQPEEFKITSPFNRTKAYQQNADGIFEDATQKYCEFIRQFEEAAKQSEEAYKRVIEKYIKQGFIRIVKDVPVFNENGVEIHDSLHILNTRPQLLQNYFNRCNWAEPVFDILESLDSVIQTRDILVEDSLQYDGYAIQYELEELDSKERVEWNEQNSLRVPYQPGWIPFWANGCGDHTFLNLQKSYPDSIPPEVAAYLPAYMHVGQFWHEEGRISPCPNGGERFDSYFDQWRFFFG